MSAHTPGPWSIWGPCHEGDEFRATNTKPGYEITAPSENASVAWVEWNHGDDEAKVAATADAALIAAAPDLLAALEAVLPWANAWFRLGESQHGPMPAMKVQLDAARAAIANARGK